MKTLVVGTGGVGGYFGARLVEHGYDVTFVTTSRSKKIIAERGLRIRSPKGDLHLQVKVTDTFGEKADLIVLTVKSQHLEKAIEGIESSFGENTIILPLLNGVYATRMLRERFGERVLGGFCKVISFKEETGVIRHLGSGIIELGEIDGGVTDRVRQVRELFSSSGIETKIHDDFLTAQWEKLILIGPLGAVGSVTRATFGQMRAIREVRSLIRKVFLEATAVARSQGANVTDDLADRYLKWVDSLPADGTTSLQRDIVAGIPSELDYLVGDIVRLGKAPILEALYAALLPQERKSQKEQPLSGNNMQP